MIPYAFQDIKDSDIAAVEAVLRSAFLTQGAAVPRFEDAIKNYCKVKNAVAVTNGTSALHIACLALGLGKDDVLWTSPNTFVASANCALYCGATVDFIDIDPHTYNMSVDALALKLEVASAVGKLPKIVVPVHFAGQPCDMEGIFALSKKYGFKIIEDASHAIGACYAGTKIGSCQYSDVTVFSFHPVKIITTGEGGMAVSNDDEIASRMRRLRSHGITSDKTLMRKRSENEIWNYQQIDLGFNYRMTDIQAALGESQMGRIDEYVGRRHQIAEKYNKELSSLKITLPRQSPKTYSSYHLYPICVDEDRTGVCQRQAFDKLWESGIAVNLHYIPVHRHPYYETLGFKKNDFPVAERFHREVITLPMFPGLTDKDHDFVIEITRKIFQL